MPVLNIDFSATAGDSIYRCIEPCLHIYESNKKLKVLQLKQKNIEIPEAGFIQQLADQYFFDDERLLRLWKDVFSKKIYCAFTNEYQISMPALFPGHTLPGSGKYCSHVYRGASLFDQYLHLLSFELGTPTLQEILDGPSNVKFASNSSISTIYWPWHFIEKPSIHFISAELEDMNKAHTPQSKNELLNWLITSSFALINKKANIEEILNLIHRAWSGDLFPKYKENCLALAETILYSNIALVDRSNLLPILFELEASVSYTSELYQIKPLASGFYTHNWVDVGSIFIADYNATELCVTERLFDELINLPTRGFAPIIVNEFNTISDGNHRLTAIWMWNILTFCKDEHWAIDDNSFQSKLALYIRDNGESMGPVVVHETLRHLALWLNTSKFKSRLDNYFRHSFSNSYIKEVPAVFVPEYSSGAVIKEAYDNGLGITRAHPKLFSYIKDHSGGALEPRASYHFTDCSLLPWLHVLPSKTIV